MVLRPADLGHARSASPLHSAPLQPAWRARAPAPGCPHSAQPCAAAAAARAGADVCGRDARARHQRGRRAGGGRAAGLCRGRPGAAAACPALTIPLPKPYPVAQLHMPTPMHTLVFSQPHTLIPTPSWRVPDRARPHTRAAMRGQALSAPAGALTRCAGRGGAQTLFCGNVVGDQVVQVTRGGVRLAGAGGLRAEWRPPQGLQVNVASASASQARCLRLFQAPRAGRACARPCMSGLPCAPRPALPGPAAPVSGRAWWLACPTRPALPGTARLQRSKRAVGGQVVVAAGEGHLVCLEVGDGALREAGHVSLGAEVRARAAALPGARGRPPQMRAEGVAPVARCCGVAGAKPAEHVPGARACAGSLHPAVCTPHRSVPPRQPRALGRQRRGRPERAAGAARRWPA